MKSVLVLPFLLVLFQQFEQASSFASYAGKIFHENPFVGRKVWTKERSNGDDPKSPSPGYVFFRKQPNETKESSSPSKSYVPSGMTASEYASIRQKETEKERKMDYGAWGPRFRRTERPDGDWMVMPNLWTLGQIGNNRVLNSKEGTAIHKENPSDRLLSHRIRSLVRTYGAAFILGYVLTDCLYTGVTLWKLRQAKDLGILKRAYGLAYGILYILQHLLSMGVSPQGSRTLLVQRSLLESSAWKTGLAVLAQTHAVKIASGVLQIPLWHYLMEGVNRRWLWSKRRFVLTVSTIATAGLTLAGSILLR